MKLIALMERTSYIARVKIAQKILSNVAMGFVFQDVGNVMEKTIVKMDQTK